MKNYSIQDRIMRTSELIYLPLHSFIYRKLLYLPSYVTIGFLQTPEAMR